MRLTDAEWELAQRICTPEQIRALDYWRRGVGYKRLSVVMGIPRDSARGYVDRGRRRIAIAMLSDDRLYDAPCEAAPA